MPLVYLPDQEVLFLWESDSSVGPSRPTRSLGTAGEPLTVSLVTPEGQRAVFGRTLPLFETAAMLAVLPASEIDGLPASVAVWALASKLAIELVSRERVVPTVRQRAGRIEARWAAALSASEDSAKVQALARSFPPAAHAVPVIFGNERDVWAADALLRSFLDAVIDAVVRSTRGGPRLPAPPSARAASKAAPWDERFRAALAGTDSTFEVGGFAERSLVDELSRWSAPALGARDRLRACFRLELPEDGAGPFVLRFFLQSPDDPSLLVPAADVWQTRGRSLERFGRAFKDPQESLLEALGRAARLYASLAQALEQAKPEALELEPTAAWTFLSEGAPLLAEAGFGVIVPGELTSTGSRRLRLRLRVGGKSKVAGAVQGAAGLGLDELLAVDWQAVIGDHPLTPRELAALAKQKAPLVRFRGAWVAVDPHELSDIQRRLDAGPSRMTVREAVQVALAGEARQGSLTATVTTTGILADVLDRLRTATSSRLRAPPTLQATLRHYQELGLAWLDTMSSLGLGACLADDMGLGKTMQLLAFLLRRREQQPDDERPALLVAPTSVLGNWEREVERFAPSLPIVAHYGSERARSAAELAASARSLVVTSYGVLRRDAELLGAVEWSVVLLDEAQNIKNAASASARAARGLRGSQRFALTGTPVENRLAELWSILEFANPGLLGPLESFRREFAVPIERFGNDEAANRLRRLVGPFILRRLKTDPAVLQDLPAKHEMKVVCTLTREQATLYRAVVDEEMRKIEAADGIERKGRVLALLTFTKQICNHPAQYLSESGPLANRSGKLARLTEMLDEALAAGDKALIFTQFREMGDKLVRHLEAAFGREVAFLHGGTSKRARDALVERFQHANDGPALFVLSVKAGGTGLNLTAANHVFHYDRWWNPAVENQATDRAHRIGQRRAVQVHKLVCAGTVEEKIDRLLEQKQRMADKIVGSSERWITELAPAELEQLFSLSAGAVASDADDSAALERTTPRQSPEVPRSEALR